MKKLIGLWENLNESLDPKSPPKKMHLVIYLNDKVTLTGEIS